MIPTDRGPRWVRLFPHDFYTRETEGLDATTVGCHVLWFTRSLIEDPPGRLKNDPSYLARVGRVEASEIPRIKKELRDLWKTRGRWLVSPRAEAEVTIGNERMRKAQEAGKKAHQPTEPNQQDGRGESSVSPSNPQLHTTRHDTARHTDIHETATELETVSGISNSGVKPNGGLVAVSPTIAFPAQIVRPPSSPEEHNTEAMRDLLRLCMCQLTGKIDWDRPDHDITSKIIKACRGADFPTIERKLLKVATAQTKPDVDGWGYWLGVANNQFGGVE